MQRRSLPFCRTCDFFVQEAVESSNNRGQCRESSPQVVIVLNSNKEENKPLTRWPIVKGTQGCGKHSDFIRTLG